MSQIYHVDRYGRARLDRMPEPLVGEFQVAQKEKKEVTNFLLYCPESSVTGRALLEAMQDQGMDIHGGTKPPEKQVQVLIRWGAPAKIARRPVKVINRGDAIQAASNKREALETMRRAGIRVPELLKDDNSNLTFPLLGRKDHHVGANDIVLCLQKQDIDRARQTGCTHFSKYIPTKAEYRVHVFGDNIIKVSQKILTDPEKATQPWIRNFDAGYTFRQPETRLSGAARGMAIDAVSALGLTFGAVDVIIGDDDQPYVLEVNTAPGLQTDTSLEAYLEQFRAVIK